MPSYKVQDIEKVKEMEYKGEPATILQLTLEEPNGDTTQAEMFTTARTTLPEVGGVVEGTIESSQYGLKFKPERKGGGGFKRSPAETAAIQRQHSEEMALRREANIIAAGGQPYSGEQLRSVINWFEEDIKGKDRAIKWDGLTSDVPADVTDLGPNPRAA